VNPEKNRMRILVLLATLAIAAAFPALAQTTLPAKTTPQPIVIATGLTYQVALAAGTRRSLTIQNNNASDTCYLLVGGPWQAGDTTSTSRTINGVSLTGIKGAIMLPAGQAYTRYFPYVPNDAILATCATSSDSLYVDFQ
jgi:hypothetical protein